MSSTSVAGRVAEAVAEGSVVRGGGKRLGLLLLEHCAVDVSMRPLTVAQCRLHMGVHRTCMLMHGDDDGGANRCC